MEPRTGLRIAPGQNPALLRDYLSAHFAQERASVFRELLVHLLAALSALVWVAAVRPRWLGLVATDSVLAMWAVFALATLGAVLAEARWRKRCLALRRKVGAAPPAP
ncbi:MAG TPA: hypothetical protein VGK67_23025 [Myxococcales bacterium]